jgi:hypothetical protein
MTQRQIKNHKSDNILVIIGSTRVLLEIILKFRHIKYRRSERKNVAPKTSTDFNNNQFKCKKMHI